MSWEPLPPQVLIPGDGLYSVAGGSLVTAGLVVEGGFVVRCAPILRRWAQGRAFDEVAAEAARRGMRLTLIG